MVEQDVRCHNHLLDQIQVSEYWVGVETEVTEAQKLGRRLLHFSFLFGPIDLLASTSAKT